MLRVTDFKEVELESQTEQTPQQNFNNRSRLPASPPPPPELSEVSGSPFPSLGYKQVGSSQPRVSRTKRKVINSSDESEEDEKEEERRRARSGEECKHSDFDPHDYEGTGVESKALQESHFFMNLRKMTNALDNIFQVAGDTNFSKTVTKVTYLFDDLEVVARAKKVVTRFDPDAIFTIKDDKFEARLQTSKLKKLIGVAKAAMYCHAMVIVACLVLFLVIYTLFK